MLSICPGASRPQVLVLRVAAASGAFPRLPDGGPSCQASTVGNPMRFPTGVTPAGVVHVGALRAMRHCRRHPRCACSGFALAGFRCGGVEAEATAAPVVVEGILAAMLDGLREFARRLYTLQGALLPFLLIAAVGVATDITAAETVRIQVDPMAPKLRGIRALVLSHRAPRAHPSGGPSFPSTRFARWTSAHRTRRDFSPLRRAACYPEHQHLMSCLQSGSAAISADDPQLQGWLASLRRHEAHSTVRWCDPRATPGG